MRKKNHTRADSAIVTNIKSDAFSVTLPATADTIPEPISPEKVARMGYPLAWLQEVVWETYNGMFGPTTLLKEVEYSTAECDECGGTGWKDEVGDTICEDCGLVMNASPEMVPRSYEGHNGGGGPTSGSANYVFFNDGSGKTALNQNVPTQPAEADVQ